MPSLFMRLWWGLVAMAYLALPALAQQDVVWLQKAPHDTLHMDISPDNRWVAVDMLGRPGTSIYQLPERRLVRIMPGGWPVFAGNRLIALSTREEVILHDVPSFRPVYRLPTSGWLQASRDGRWLLVYRDALWVNRVAELWELTPPQRRLSLALPDGSEVALSENGRYLFEARPVDTNSMEVTARALPDGQVVRRFRVNASGVLAASPSGDRIAFAMPTQVKVFRVADAQLLYTLTDVGSFGFSSLRFSPDGNYLAGGYGPYYERGAWRLWRLTDGVQIAGRDYRYPDEVWQVAFSSDSTTLYVVFPSQIVSVDTFSGTVRDRWQAPRNEKTLGFLSSEEQIAIADEQSVRFYASADGSLVRQVDVPGAPPFAAAISGDGSTYAVYPYQNGIGVFHLPASGPAVHLLTIPLFPLSSLDEPRLLRLSEDGSALFVWDYSGWVHRVHVADGTISTLVQSSYDFDITPDGSILVTQYGEITVSRVADGAILYTLPPAQWFAVVQDGRSLATVRQYDSEYVVSLYDLLTGNLLRQTSLWLPTDYPEDIATVIVSPDAQVIYTQRRYRAQHEAACYHWDSMGTHTVALWRGNAVPFNPIFSRGGRYILFSESYVTRGFSGKTGVPGHVLLDGWSGVFPEHLRYTLRDAATAEVLDEGTLPVTDVLDTAIGSFILPIPADRDRASLRLTIAGTPFLKRTVLVSEISSPQPVSLLLGDIDGDNEVTLFDFGRMVAAFGSFAGEERYDIDADLDGDGEISLWDFSWLVANFGMVGDE
ncbi:MAG: hypothetical protein ACP5RN_14505 [Armatimonadota bacterium]